MPWVDLGEVVGKDGEIGNVNSTYINNGGDPGVNIVRSGDDGAPDFTFEFENLANDPLSESELEQIVAGQTVSSASVVNGTVLSNFMSALGSVFAAIDHKHDASDIDSGTLAAERIANDSIGTEKFKPAVRDSLSRTSLIVQTETKQCAAGGWVQLEGTADLTGGLKVVGVIKAMASSPANFAIAGFSVSDDGNVVVNVTRISSGTPVDVHAYLTIKVSKA